MVEKTNIKKVTTKPRPKKKLTPEQEAVEALKKEKKVKVYGNPMFIQSGGDQYTFLYNGNPVTIFFNETYQEYPETVAKLLEAKLAKMARSSTSRNVNTKIS